LAERRQNVPTLNYEPVGGATPSTLQLLRAVHFFTSLWRWIDASFPFDDIDPNIVLAAVMAEMAAAFAQMLFERGASHPKFPGRLFGEP
jgi:hypothetical protein